MSTYRTYIPVLSRTCGACGQGTGRWQCSVCLLTVCTGCWHLCPSESDDAPAASSLKPQQDGSEVSSDDARLGLAGQAVIEWRQGLGTCSPSASDSPCAYCGETGGHTGQCPVVS